MKGSAMELTPEDLQREAKIGEFSAMVVSADDATTRRAYLQMLMKELAARTPAAVATLERARGLA